MPSVFENELGRRRGSEVWLRMVEISGWEPFSFGSSTNNNASQQPQVVIRHDRNTALHPELKRATHTRQLSSYNLMFSSSYL
jgi:hypothetical protein